MNKKNKQQKRLVEEARRYYQLDENQKAISLLESSELAEDADALLLLGQIHNGTSESCGGVRRSIPNAKKCWLKSLELGNSEAALELGRLNYSDKKNHKKAEEFWLIAADMENVLAAFELVNYYYNHRNDKIDKAIKLCHWLIEKNEFVGNCYLTLGRIYYRGIGVPRDVAQALHWLEKGVSVDHGNSCLDLAWMYYLGEGVEKNVSKAISLVEKAGQTEWLRDAAPLIVEKMRSGTLIH